MVESNKKIGIVMTYINRQYQLDKTIESINKQNYNNLFVVVVDDNSDDEIVLPTCNFDIKIIRIGNEKKWTNPEPAYNTGILYLIENTDCEIIILQNAECYHVGNVLEYASENTNVNNYITFGCYSLDYNSTFNTTLDINNLIATELYVTGDCTNGWYNHPIHRPVKFEFCAAIHKDNLIKLNGYDERFSLGIGYGDNFLLHRIGLLNLDIQITTNPFVIHQWHDHNYKNGIDAGALIGRNCGLYNSLLNEKIIKAQHLFTKDLI